jgi:CBS domain-containing protein
MQLNDELVRTRMTLQPVTVDRDTPLDQVLATFGKYPFRHLPVTGGNEVLGILSDRDVLLATGWLSDDERTVDDETPSPHVVRDIMTTPVHTLPPEATVGEAARLILDERIGALPVVDHVGLLGIITETDLLRALHDSDEITDRSVRARDLMHVNVQTAAESDDLLTASGALFDSGIRHLPVVRSDKVVAMLSDRDVRLGLARLSWQDSRLQHEGDSGIPSLKVGDVMTERPYTIAPACELPTAISCMLEERLGALPVVDKGKLVGILSRYDALRLFLGDAAATSP